MRILILYSSYYKNHTEKVARAISEKIGADMVHVRQAHEVDIENYDLIGFGSGVYRESLSPMLYTLVDSLDLSGRNVFVFSTSGVGLKVYNSRLIRRMKSRGAVVRGSFACRGSFRAKDFTEIKIFRMMERLAENHPTDRELRNAEKFIVDVLKTISR